MVSITSPACNPSGVACAVTASASPHHHLRRGRDEEQGHSQQRGVVAAGLQEEEGKGRIQKVEEDVEDEGVAAVLSLDATAAAAI